jgi:hypothetical protein
MRGPIHAPVPRSETPQETPATYGGRQRRERQKALQCRRLLVALPILIGLPTGMLLCALSIKKEPVARLKHPTVVSGHMELRSPTLESSSPKARDARDAYLMVADSPATRVSWHPAPPHRRCPLLPHPVRTRTDERSWQQGRRIVEVDVSGEGRKGALSRDDT